MEQSRFAQFDALITTAAKSVQRLKELYMSKYQLSAAHTDCLCRMLEHSEGLTQQELVALESMDKAQISRVLSVLVERGYVTCDTARAYRRRYQLTDAGRTVAQEIQDVILNVNRFVSSEIPEAEIAVFYETLHRITEQLKCAVEMSHENAELPFRPE